VYHGVCNIPVYCGAIVVENKATRCAGSEPCVGKKVKFDRGANSAELTPSSRRARKAEEGSAPPRGKNNVAILWKLRASRHSKSQVSQGALGTGGSV